MRVGINVVDLRKEFQGVGGTKVAVDNLNLRMYDGQITALLGHNGAGKTTAMSIMVGLFPPTSGTVYINGYDVRTETAQVRQSLGLCPQFDVLWDDLTVEEHLRFFAELKGMTGPGVKEEVDMFVHDLNLTGKAKERTSALSGGQKRALSVSLALVGGSKIVVLDEPTSGEMRPCVTLMFSQTPGICAQRLTFRFAFFFVLFQAWTPSSAARHGICC